jgi:hypothetical protein
MQQDDREQSQVELWKSQEEDSMQISTEEVSAKARRHERESVRGYWTLLSVTPLFAGAFVYNLMHFRDPWLIAGTAWALAAVCYFLWTLIRNGPTRMVAAEPCAQFLRAKTSGIQPPWLLRLPVLPVK